MKKKLLVILLLFVTFYTTNAAPPANYYDVANNKSGSTLRTALQGIITNHTVVSYDNLRYLYQYSDTENAQGVTIVDIYSTCGFAFSTSFCSAGCGGGFNREHSVPKSWFNEATPMYSDAFHLYPTSCYVNSYRGNYPFGECAGGVKCTTNGMTTALGKRGNSTFSGYSGVVFEPDDEYKGDLARTYFYMATRYAGQCESWTGDMFGSSYNGFNAYAKELLIKWHRQDPVSQKEILRNEVIYGNSTYNKSPYKQNNRNPFIDYPCLAEYLWGDKVGETVSFSALLGSFDPAFTVGSSNGCSTTPTPTITSPTSGMSLNVGTTAVSQQVYTTITVKGILLTENLTLSIAGANASFFSLSTGTVSASEAIAGKTITVYYTPSSSGSHTATLSVSSSQCSSTVTLLGNCGFHALSATNVETSGFCANWSDAGVAGYTLNVYKEEIIGNENVQFFDELFSSDIGDFEINDVEKGSLAYVWKWISAAYGVKATGFNGSPIASESWLISPLIDLKSAVSATLTFDHTTYQAANNASYLKLFVSENKVNWTELSIPNWPSTRWTFVSSEGIDLGAYVGKSVYIAFKYKSTTVAGLSCDTWEIKNLFVKGQQPTMGKAPLLGYPKTVGNVLNHCLTELTPNTTYYYTVIPNGGVVSNEISVTTLQSASSVENVKIEKPSCFVFHDRVELRNLPSNSTFYLFDTIGRLILKKEGCNITETIYLQKKGLHILQINIGNRIETYKIMN